MIQNHGFRSKSTGNTAENTHHDQQDEHYLFGEVHVFDLNTGKLVEILALGPEVNGQSAWEDAAMGLRAFKRRDGEYLIFTENSGWGGKNNFFRWRPSIIAP
jgi:hypothetical protein